MALKIETQPRDDQQVTVIAEFDQDTLEKYKHKAARKIANEAKIPGFRPGKAPYDVVCRTAGEDMVLKQAVDLLVDEQYSEVLKEANIEPSGPGSLVDIISYEPVKLNFLVPLMPEIKLGDYKAIRKEYNNPEVGQEQVDQVINRLRYSYSTAENVDRPAEIGDLVYFKVTGAIKDPAEGENPLVLDDRPGEALVGGNEVQPDNFPYEGFSKELIGLSKDEEKSVTYTYPETSNFDKLRGKTIDFKFVVSAVMSIKMPDANDEFAQTVGEFENFEGLQSNIRARLEEDSSNHYNDNYFNELVDTIAGAATIKYPPHYLEDEQHEVLHSIENDLAQQKLDLDTYLKMQKTDRKDFIENEVKPVAMKRLTRSLVMGEIAKLENIQPDKEEINNALAQSYGELVQAPDFKRMSKKISSERLANAVAVDTYTRLVNQHVLEHLKKIAIGEAEAEASAPQPAAEEVAAPAAVTEAPEKTETEAQPAKPKTRKKKTAE
jgi:trigger factor